MNVGTTYPYSERGDAMTWRKWAIVGLGAAASLGLGSWLASLPESQMVAPRTGPTFWDGVSIVIGLLLGLLIRLALKRQATAGKRKLVGIIGMGVALTLPFLPWPESFPWRSLVVPGMELVFVAWGVSGLSPAPSR